MRAIWKGTISFGLISIPVTLFPAAQHDELKFRMLRASDLSPINFKRVAEADGKEVPWDQIVKGYEYEKGKFVVLKDEDFARVDVEATQTVDILNFVKLEELNPVLFHKPYYMEAGKGGERAYLLLAQALTQAKKVAISKVVIKTRQYLAAVKPQGETLVLELMHFPDEVKKPPEVQAPHGRALTKPEMNMALKLIESMSAPWKPEGYKDDYHLALEEMIEKKIAHGGKPAPALKKTRPAKASTDLLAELRKSLEHTKPTSHKPKRSPPARGQLRAH